MGPYSFSIILANVALLCIKPWKNESFIKTSLIRVKLPI